MSKLTKGIKIVGEENEEAPGIHLFSDTLYNGEIPVLGISSYDRPRYSVEVDKALKKIFKEEKRVDSEGDLVEILENGSELVIKDYPVTVEEINYYMGNYKIDKVLFSSSKMEIDILESTITIDLIEPDQYTNTVDLLKVEKKTMIPGLKAKVDLSVKYSIGPKIYGQDLTFEAFRYGDDLNVTKENFISSLGDVTVEYVDGIVKVIPSSSKVGECIISNCVVTYGCQ